MSAIAGIRRVDGAPVDVRTLECMAARQRRRGGDGDAAWVDGAIGLAHGLRATTLADLRERQPLADATQRCRIVWDGRLDNRGELLSALTPTPPPDASDAALVLAAWRRWGPPCAGRLLGDFAFAVWDAEERTLGCARDRLGIKPLHYTWDGHAFRFASTIEPLIDGDAEPDDDMLLAFLLREFRAGDESRTFLRNVRRLLPGHVLVLRHGALAVTPFWQVDPARTIVARDEQEYAERFLALFREAVSCRLRSDFPVGAELSGFDSTSIVATAQQLYIQHGEGSPPLETFTLYGDTAASDERPWARQVAAATGLKLHEVYGADRAPLAVLDGALHEAGSPVVGPNHESTAALLDAVAAAGCRVLLSGEGGDQLLDETGYLADLLCTGRVIRFARELRGFAAWYGADALELVIDALKALLPPSVAYHGKRLLRRAPPPWINAAAARRMELGARIRAARDAVRFPSWSQTQAYRSIASPWYGLKLEADERFAAERGFDARYPFLDSRLVEFVLAIPWDRRPSRGQRKRLLRLAMRGIVPEAVLGRRGKGDWTEIMDAALRPVCEAGVVAAGRSTRFGWLVRRARARALATRYLAGAGDTRWDLWFLVSAERWLARLEAGAWP